ncbi:MAG: YraN family protein [Apibacter sp.]|uniref:UPF0102 protein Ga0061079_1123 n=1 Tax=Apibacter mensalis TaxID=1586267 RepID=A0A0X3AR87_9FLAO|nr:YraN family protein [Apibacter mensalis]MCO6565091.1 YraN family protein [Apibacter sp.]CVK16872.1 putative endonuclease [Apibacter mensalis]
MAYHNDFGKEAENKAFHYLLDIGYEILDKNWKFQKAEIDIIAKNDSELIVVEVKARNYTTIIDPIEAVTWSKRKLLIKAANEYVLCKDLDVDVRFDIISIIKKDYSWKIEHIKDAFSVVL